MLALTGGANIAPSCADEQNPTDGSASEAVAKIDASFLISSSLPPEISRPYSPVNRPAAGLGGATDALGVVAADAEAAGDGEAVALAATIGLGRCCATPEVEPHADTSDAIATTAATSRMWRDCIPVRAVRRRQTSAFLAPFGPGQLG